MAGFLFVFIYVTNYCAFGIACCVTHCSVLLLIKQEETVICMSLICTINKVFAIIKNSF